ncbi:MAG: anaerobic glycerol-3-phosphate dehydrogenase subunit B [bacterium]|nr:anaerobic glycerol-3-phosphate dehydrogenase subunit B [bacterium]
MSELKNAQQGRIDCDLAVIGAGMTGMAASVFAAKRGISTVQVGNIDGGLIFSSSLIDLMAVHPIQDKKIWENPWEAIDALVKDSPEHPYARISKEDIQKSIEEMLGFFTDAGYSYYYEKDKNLELLTAQGTIKHTYCVPYTMKPGVTALAEKAPCLIVGFQGLKEFSALQVTETAGSRWPSLRALTIPFPGSENKKDLYIAHLARALELPGARIKLAEQIKANLKDEKYIGLPAMLGINRTKIIIDHLEKEIGVPVFEIPTMPTSVPGLRLKEVFEANLPGTGVKQVFPGTVTSVTEEGGSFIIEVGDTGRSIKAKAIILASGRFLGKGLIADRVRIREAIFDLPVTQPGHRNDWHTVKFLDPSGHPVDKAGLEIDNNFRPLNASGKPAFENLYAAGSILAHQDWKRMKCGAGLAIATAYAAVNGIKKENK